MKAKIISAFLLMVVLAILLVMSGAVYSVKETEQVIVTQFGEPIGEPITGAGLQFKVPFIQDVNRIEKRVLAWDGTPNEMPTKDKTYIIVDTFARWRITDPLTYFQRLSDERRALSRLDDILGSETRNTIARHELIEVVRTTKDRTPERSETLEDAGLDDTVGKLVPIRKGRAMLEQEILERSKPKLDEFGIDLLDVRFKRINYNQDVRDRIYERMISERQQIAELFRSEGAGEAAKILGKKERDLKEIESTAYKQIQQIQGEADAEATEIYAKAFNQSADSAEFYRFVKTMETYEEVLGGDSTIILSTDSDLFKFLKGISPEPAPSAEPKTPKAPSPAPPQAIRQPSKTPAAPPQPARQGNNKAPANKAEQEPASPAPPAVER